MVAGKISRRILLASYVASNLIAALGLKRAASAAQAEAGAGVSSGRMQDSFLSDFDYGKLQLADGPARRQFEQTISVILGLNEDSMLRPMRQRAGLPAPGQDLGGWYDAWDGTDIFHDIERGFAPAHSFGQWVSALARAHAITGSVEMKAKVQRLLAEFAKIPAEKFFKGLRYPGYTYDKMVCAFLDARKWAGQSDAFQLLDATTDKVMPLLPEKALTADEFRQRPHIDESYCWDELYTLPENLYLAYAEGAGSRYKDIAAKYLKDEGFFDQLADGVNVLPGHHAYSYCNSLSSAMMAYMVAGSKKHLQAAKNAFDMLQSTQSFATGAWGPNEGFVNPGKGELASSLKDSHKSFETPCGAYAHFKL